MVQRRQPGVVRDAILKAFTATKGAQLSVAEIRDAVIADLGQDVPASSIRSYLNINTPGKFIRTGHGTYRLVRR